MNDNDIANLLAKEARQQSLHASRVGPIAYLMSERAPPAEKPSVINKTFLANTVRSVEAHNRREEIDDGWRQHQLLQRKRPSTEENEAPRSRRRIESTQNVYESERDHWSLKKLKAFASPSTHSLPDSHSISSSSSSSDSSMKDKKRKKKHKKSSKSKHKKEKKSKKKISVDKDI